jgi:hypothetical protein
VPPQSTQPLQAFGTSTTYDAVLSPPVEKSPVAPLTAERASGSVDSTA